MKKVLLALLVLFVFPVVALADIDDNEGDNTTTTTKETVESPDTGVSDYFMVLGSIVVVVSLGVYILNKKEVFKTI